MPPKYNKKRLLWLDLEMTGLSPQTDKILEIAAIVTDYDFNVIDTYDSVVFQEDSILEKMDEVVRSIHTRSGLLDRIKDGKSLQIVESELEQFIFRNFPTYDFEKVVLAGNSVQVDRDFIMNQMPFIAEFIHYRIIDVSSFRMVFMCKYNKVFEKNPKNHHKATDDIQSSIDELKYYLGYLNI
jgi:oligoribonuclease